MALIKLCKNGDLEGVKALLQIGVDVNTKGEYGLTGLMWAVSKNHNSVVELLLNTPNIDVNLKSDDYWCPLDLAVEYKNIEALKMLLDVPTIDVNIVESEWSGGGSWEWTRDWALHCAVWKAPGRYRVSTPIGIMWHDNWKTLQLLLSPAEVAWWVFSTASGALVVGGVRDIVVVSNPRR